MLFVDLIVPYVLEGKYGSEVGFMCLTMMEPATNWFKIVELPVVEKPGLKSSNMNVSAEYFDKTSQQIKRLDNKLWFCRTLVANNFFTTTTVNSSCNSVNLSKVKGLRKRRL